MADEAAIGRRAMRATGTIALVALVALGASASTASADSLSMTFTEARADVGIQLSVANDDDALFRPPDTAPFDAQIDPGSGEISGGDLDVPQFQTHITTPINADVTVDFEIGIIAGSFNQATGALTLEGKAGGTLMSVGTPSGEEGECKVSTEPEQLKLSTGDSSGGTNPRFGTPFTVGLTGPGAIAGTWTDMKADPVTPEDPDEVTFCNNVYNQIGGEGGVWLEQEGDVVPPSAPQLTSTDPASPGSSGTPRILGTAEAGSTVHVYGGADCVGVPVATGSATELGSPGVTVEVAEGVSAVFSASATDAAGNTSACSAPISYERLKAPDPPPPPADIVAPVAWNLKFAPRRFRPGRHGAASVSKTRRRKGKRRSSPRTSRMSYQLSEAATVRFVVQRRVVGRRQGRRCLIGKRARRIRHRKRCRRFVRRGVFSHTGAMGINRLRFSGRVGGRNLGGRRLRPGAYRMVGIPIDAAGNRGHRFSAGFVIARR